MSRLLFLIPVVATTVVYFPLTSGYFVSDDFLNLYGIVNGDTLEYLLRPHGGHILLARNALFMLFHSFFGVQAQWYFAAVLATHLFNVVLLYRAILRWTASFPLAALGATLWGTCPVQAGALEWYSVYGQVVVASLLLVVLNQVSGLNRAGDAPPRSVLILWPLLFMIASTSFGTGLALTFVSPIALYLLLPPSRRRLQVCAVLLALALLTWPAYRALVAWHDQLVRSGGGIFNVYITLGGLHYPESILSLFGYLLSSGITSLLLSFAAVGSQFPTTTSTLATGLYAVAMIATLVLAPARLRRLALGLLLLAAACYGLIAVGRALYTRAPEIAAAATRTRYHYVATIPLTVLACLMLNQLTSRLRRRTAVHGLLLVLWLSAVVVPFRRAAPFIDAHANARAETARVLDRIRAAIADTAPGAEVRIPNNPFYSIGPLLFDPRSGFPGWAGLFTIFFPTNVVDGRRVQFVVNNPAILEAAAAGKRTHDLIVLGDVTGASPAPPLSPPPSRQMF